MVIIKDFDTSRISTMGVGGRCDFYCEVDSEKQWGHVLSVSEGQSVFIVGGGSNTVFGDEFHGIIIKLCGEFKEVRAEGTGLICGGGANLKRVSSIAKANSLGGMAELSGIFGTVGGGAIGNAGAFGRSLSDIVEWVEVLTPFGAERIAKSECGFSYRSSKIRGVISRVKLSLFERAKSEIETEELFFQKRRMQTQPCGRSCGSVFLRERLEGCEVVPARLIDEAGLKGYKVGALEVSKKHAGFIVNHGGGTPSEYFKIKEDVKRVVYEKYGILLKEEVKFIGNLK